MKKINNNDNEVTEIVVVELGAVVVESVGLSVGLSVVVVEDDGSSFGTQSSVEHPTSNGKNLVCNPNRPNSGAKPLNTNVISFASRMEIDAFLALASIVCTKTYPSSSSSLELLPSPLSDLPTKAGSVPNSPSRSS